jgi:hypothetical protein
VQLSGWEAVRYGMLCDAMLEGDGDAMGGGGGERASERLRCHN